MSERFENIDRRNHASRYARQDTLGQFIPCLVNAACECRAIRQPHLYGRNTRSVLLCRLVDGRSCGYGQRYGLLSWGQLVSTVSSRFGRLASHLITPFYTLFLPSLRIRGG